MIKAPYNFVPLNNKIFFPEWADEVSHDIPFSDGENGEIELEITAKSPIYVKNGSLDKDDTTFSNFKKVPFIPGTSIKGMLRSVLETLSFSKMGPTDDRKFSWRDLSNEKYTSNFTSGIKAKPNTKAGFIIEENGEWYLVPCDYARIEQYEIDDKIGTSNNYLSGPEKYKFWTTHLKKSLVNKFYISKNSSTQHFKKQCGKYKRARFTPFDTSELKDGVLVFTGQIAKRNSGNEGEHGKGKKHLEFVFFDEQNEKQKIDKSMVRDFVLNHVDTRNKAKHRTALAPNDEYGYWKDKMETGGKMPVFYLEDENNKISSFGLAMLYRLPYKNSVQDLIKKTNPNHLKIDKLDLAELMFGKTTNNNPLKGRIQFSHAFLKGDYKVGNEKSEVLSSPKPTFYPSYLSGGFVTYDDDDQARISGRKRYPIHKTITKTRTDNQNITTSFIPIESGAKFICKVRFHNLREVEIGALLSSLTFHGNENEFFHSIGMAKPLGFGKIMIKLKSISINKSAKHYMAKFEELLNIKLFKGDSYWHESKEITNLFTMAKEADDEKLKYLDLDDFRESKKGKERLKRYTEIADKIIPDPLSDIDTVKMKRDIEKYKNNCNKPGFEGVIEKLKYYSFLIQNEIETESNTQLLKELGKQAFEEHLLKSTISKNLLREYYEYYDFLKEYYENLKDPNNLNDTIYYSILSEMLDYMNPDNADNGAKDKIVDILSKNVDCCQDRETYSAIKNLFKKELEKQKYENSDNEYLKLVGELKSGKKTEVDCLDLYRTIILPKSAQNIIEEEGLYELLVEIELVTRNKWGKKKSKKNKYFKHIKNLIKEKE